MRADARRRITLYYQTQVSLQGTGSEPLGLGPSSTLENGNSLASRNIHSAELEATVLYRGMKTGISEASKRVSIFSFATQGGKQVSFYFRQRNWVQAREAQIRFPAGRLEFDSTVRHRGMGTAPMGTILRFASVSLRKNSSQPAGNRI